MALTPEQIRDLAAEVIRHRIHSIDWLETWWALADLDLEAYGAMDDLVDAIHGAHVDITWPDRAGHDGAPAAPTTGTPQTTNSSER